jgi:hypothetical protein
VLNPQNADLVSTSDESTEAGSTAMFTGIKTGFINWLLQLRALVRHELMDLDPHEYTLGLLFCIAIGWILLSGRR